MAEPSSNDYGHVEKLVWELVDREQITESQMAELNRLLAEDGEARRVYIDCMQLHADLSFYFSRQDTREPPPENERPVLPVDLDMPTDGPHSIT